MNQHAILTAVGADRPGLVDEVSRFIFERGGNLEDSRMVNLRGQFAMMVLIGGSTQTLEKLASGLAQLERESTLHAELHPAQAERAAASAAAVPYRLTATAMDQAGLVNRVSHLLRTLNVNIESLETHLVAAPITGTPLFEMELAISVPREVGLANLRQSLGKLCDELNIDWQLGAMSTMRSFLSHVPRAEARAVTLTVVVGVSLLIVKFIAYFLTHSAAVYSDALESIVNVAASGMAMYSLVLAHRPPDEEHPYGHGKVEFLSATFEGGMIVLAAIVIAGKAISALVRGSPIEQLGVGLVLMAAAMVVNGGVGLYLIRTGRRQNSMTLEADGKHLLSDAVTSVAVLVALGVVQVTQWKQADPIAALLIAGYITRMGLGLLRRAAAGLMDEQNLWLEKLSHGILDSHLGPAGKEPRICSYHKLRHRHSGRYRWVDFHIMIPAHLSIDQGHRVASRIEYEIEQAMGEGNATAHVEPCADASCGCCAPAPAAGTSDKN